VTNAQRINRIERRSNISNATIAACVDIDAVGVCVCDGGRRVKDEKVRKQGGIRESQRHV